MRPHSIVDGISLTCEWLTQLPIKDSELEYTCVPLPLPEIPSLTPMAVNTFQNKRQKPRTTKKKRGDNRNKISAAGEQMDMLIDFADSGKWEPNSAMEKAKGKTSITEPPPKGLGID